MTVSQLIDRLKKAPQDLPVSIMHEVKFQGEIHQFETGVTDMAVSNTNVIVIGQELLIPDSERQIA